MAQLDERYPGKFEQHRGIWTAPEVERFFAAMRIQFNLRSIVDLTADFRKNIRVYEGVHSALNGNNSRILAPSLHK